MTFNRLRTVVALSLLFSLPALAVPAPTSSGVLSGVVRATGDAPLQGARVFAGDPQTGDVFPSEPTGPDGTFEIDGLPSATYEIAVESEEGLYLIDRPVPLADGSHQALGISIAPGMNGEDTGADDSGGGQGGGGSGNVVSRRPSLWNNPLTAAFMVLGVAIVLGIIIENATDDDDSIDEPPTSPMEM